MVGRLVLYHGRPGVDASVSPRFIPESPRFLVARGLVRPRFLPSAAAHIARFLLTGGVRIQESKAARILAHFHANGHDERDPLVIFEMAQIRHALTVEKQAAKEITWRTLFATPGNRKRMRIIAALAIFSQWRCVDK